MCLVVGAVVLLPPLLVLYLTVITLPILTEALLIFAVVAPLLCFYLFLMLSSVTFQILGEILIGLPSWHSVLSIA